MVGGHPSTLTLKITALQISELKNHSLLQALTTEANGWAPGGKSPSGPLEPGWGPSQSCPWICFSSFGFLTTCPTEFCRFTIIQGKLESTLEKSQDLSYNLAPLTLLVTNYVPLGKLNNLCVYSRNRKMSFILKRIL